MPSLPDPHQVNLVYYPEPSLRQVAAPLAQVEPFHRELAKRMAAVMAENQGVGLAANQVGWLERLVVISLTGEPDKAEAFINPQIVWSAGRLMESEGCLSVPGVRSKLRRAEKVRVVATRLDGEKVELEAAGLLARAWQHEVDHLNGMLFIDKLGPAAKILIAHRLRRLEKAREE